MWPLQRIFVDSGLRENASNANLVGKGKAPAKNIYLTVIADNKPAIALYNKVGFIKIIGRYPKWFRHKGKYLDSLTLLLVEK